MQSAPGCSKGPSREAAARSTARRIMSAMLVDAGEMVSRLCLGGEAYLAPYVEPLRDARTKPADFVNILLRSFGELPGEGEDIPCG